MSVEFEKAVAERASAGKVAGLVRRARRSMTKELDTRRASTVRVGEREWAFVLTRDAVDGWERLGSKPVTVGVLIYEQPGAPAPFVHREIAVRPGPRGLIVEVRENGLARWTGEGTVDRGGALSFKVPITRDNSPKTGLMAGRVTRDGELVLTDSRLPTPVDARQPEMVDEAKA